MKKVKQVKKVKREGEKFAWSFVIVCFLLAGAVLLNMTTNQKMILNKNNNSNFNQIEDYKISDDKLLNINTTDVSQITEKISAFFLKEDNKYVLYLGDLEGDKKPTGLAIDILQAYTDDGLKDLKPSWQISPDGKKIIYLSNTAPDYTGRLTDNGVLRISDLDGKNNEILYVQGGSSSHVSLSQFFWAQDSKSVYLLTSIADEGGYSYYLSMVDVDTKEVKTKIADDSKFSSPNDDSNIEYQSVPVY